MCRYLWRNRNLTRINVKSSAAVKLFGPAIGAELQATNHVHRWRIVGRPPDVEVSCEISRQCLENKQSQTNSDRVIPERGGGRWAAPPTAIKNPQAL